MVTVNGIDLRDLGFVARSRTLPRLGGERTTVQQIPGRYGGVRMGGAVHDDTLSVEGTISAPDHAMLLQRIDQLSRVLQGRSVIRLSDMPDREWVGYLQQGPSRASAIGPAWITRAEGVVLQWAIPDPTGRGQTEISQVPGALLLGTAPSPLRVEVQNGGTAPITRITVEALSSLLRNPDFEAGGAWWQAGAGRTYRTDPALAHGGTGFLEMVVAASGATLTAAHIDAAAGGSTRFYPVAPGDVVDWGGWARRSVGNGETRFRLLFADADRSYQSLNQTASVAQNAVWTHLAGRVTVPEGVAYVYFQVATLTPTVATTARFDDVYLQIRKPNELQRLLEWNGSIAPGALWSCDADLFQILNDGANAIDGLTAASEFPVAAPGEGGYGHVLVTITGGGSHTSTVRYRRRWL